MTEKELIRGCQQKDRQAQQLAYDRYSPKMFGVCKRYFRNSMEAEDALVEGFFKVFTKIDQFHGQGSFEGWIRRIIVNEALMVIRKRKPTEHGPEPMEGDARTTLTVEDELEAADILRLLDKLPTGYRTIFNLYVIEGYKHREIAELLNISINTSKSQLILAKKRMRELVTEQNQVGPSRPADLR
ncbi:MAG: sigma-70 family RNA polymerase sigma factor [Saprospiraceae bacterium]|nr:sigma-70 family RNA polymerase sigma factor [Saprospiraceae bacterium]